MLKMEPVDTSCLEHDGEGSLTPLLINSQRSNQAGSSQFCAGNSLAICRLTVLFSTCSLIQAFPSICISSFPVSLRIQHLCRSACFTGGVFPPKLSPAPLSHSIFLDTQSQKDRWWKGENRREIMVPRPWLWKIDAFRKGEHKKKSHFSPHPALSLLGQR